MGILTKQNKIIQLAQPLFSQLHLNPEDNQSQIRKGSPAMKIAIFGASGGTGTAPDKSLPGRRPQVTALLRSPDIFPLRDRVEVVHGNAFDPQPSARPSREPTLSSPPSAHVRSGKEDVLERGVPSIIAAMQQTGVRRIIVLGSAGALPDSLKKQPFCRRWIVENILYKTILKWPVASQIFQYNALGHDLDWTMVMPPMLSNIAARGPTASMAKPSHATAAASHART